jgi:hypothetical protein
MLGGRGRVWRPGHIGVPVRPTSTMAQCSTKPLDCGIRGKVASHDRAFALFKGACRRGIYDNMKTAVETIFVGKKRLYNRRLRCATAHVQQTR